MEAALLWAFFITITAVDIWALSLVVSKSAASRGLISRYGIVALIALIALIYLFSDHKRT